MKKTNKKASAFSLWTALCSSQSKAKKQKEKLKASVDN
jgi:hypothetical protein